MCGVSAVWSVWCVNCLVSVMCQLTGQCMCRVGYIVSTCLVSVPDCLIVSEKNGFKACSGHSALLSLKADSSNHV